MVSLTQFVVWIIVGLLGGSVAGLIVRRERFLKAIEVDALGSEQDEPGCMRFNVLQDEQDQNVYYYYEVYRDEAALEAHRAAPHSAVWRAAAGTLDGAAEATRCQTVFPAADEYWSRNK